MSLNELAQEINDNARAHGFWDGERNFGEMIALAHSELSEALEEHRSGRPDEYFQINGEQVWRVDDGSGSDWSTANGEATYTGVLAKPEGVAVELADCLIRCLDTMHSLGINIDAVVARKMAYNARRRRNAPTTPGRATCAPSADQSRPPQPAPSSDQPRRPPTSPEAGVRTNQIGRPEE